MIGGITLAELRELSKPRVFGRTLLEREPYPAQDIALLCTHSHVLDVTGRGVGKSTVLIGDNGVRKASVFPWLAAALNGRDKPVPVRIVLIASVTDQAFEIQSAIRESLEGDP